MSRLADMLIEGGLLPLAILGLVALEAVALHVLRRGFGVGPGLAPMSGNLLSGAFLVLALHVALVGGAAELILLCLAASCVAHLGDLVCRMRPGKTVLPRTREGLRAQDSV